MTSAAATKRKLVLKMSVSLGGFVSGPNGEADWIFRTMGASTGREWVAETLRNAGVHIGIKDGTFVDRTTRAPGDVKNDSIGHRTGATPSATVLQSWAGPTVVRGDLAEEVVRLKGQPGNFILAHGGAKFARSLVASGLIDEYRLVVHPVVLGRGQPTGLTHRAVNRLRMR